MAEHPVVTGKRGPGVLQVVLSLTAGGAERTVVELVTRSEGTIRNMVCCLDCAGEWAGQLTGRGVPLVVLGRPPGFHPSIGARLARVAAAHGAGVIHCHQYSPFVYSQIARLFRPTLRVVFTEQGRLSDAGPSAKRTLVNRLLGTLPCRIYAVSRDLREYMIAEGFPARRVGVIPNAVDPRVAPDEEARRAARSRLQITQGSFVVGTAARFDPVKSLETLVEAFAEIVRGLTDSTLVLIGDGPERQMLEAMVKTRELSGSVRFTGMRSDVRDLLPALDVYVNCSVSEGTSLTIMEAMAASLPVVATRVGGNPEVVAEGVTGLLVPSRSPGSLARAVLSFWTDRQLAVQFGLAGRQRMETEFAIDRVVARYLRVYRGEEV